MTKEEIFAAQSSLGFNNTEMARALEEITLDSLTRLEDLRKRMTFATPANWNTSTPRKVNINSDALITVDNLLEEAERLVWERIEKEVIKIIISPKNRANTFICAMGGWFWLDKDGERIPEDCKYLAPVENIFDRYNGYFNLYGAGVRWDLKDGEVKKCTDW